MLSSPFIQVAVVRRRGCGAGPVRGWRGFTLIELLIVLVIVAILAAFAYPAYRDQIRRTRRADAEGVLTQAAQFMERRYSENGTYVLPEDVTLPYDKSPIDGNDRYYDIGVVSTATTFTLTADPVDAGPEADAGILTLDETGRRGRDLDGDDATDGEGEDHW